MKDGRIVIVLILVLSTIGCQTESTSASEARLERKAKAHLDTDDVSLSVAFIEHMDQSRLIDHSPDSLQMFKVSSQLKNTSKDTLTFLNMICAKESFYSVSPAFYIRWRNNLCWSEGFNSVSIAPGEHYAQEILVAYPSSMISKQLPNLKLGFLVQSFLENGKVDSLEIWSRAIEVPSR